MKGPQQLENLEADADVPTPNWSLMRETEQRYRHCITLQFDVYPGVQAEGAAAAMLVVIGYAKACKDTFRVQEIAVRRRELFVRVWLAPEIQQIVDRGYANDEEQAAHDRALDTWADRHWHSLHALVEPAVREARGLPPIPRMRKVEIALPTADKDQARVARATLAEIQRLQRRPRAEPDERTEAGEAKTE